MADVRNGNTEDCSQITSSPTMVEDAERPAAGLSDSRGYSVTLPENKEIYWSRLQPMVNTVMTLEDANIIFGDGETYHVILPGGHNPYFYCYEDASAVWQILLLALSCKHNWKTSTDLELAIRQEAEDAKIDLSGVSKSKTNYAANIERIFKSTFPDFSFMLDNKFLIFRLPTKLDANPVFDRISTGETHFLPYSTDGLQLADVLVHIASLAKAKNRSALTFLELHVASVAEQAKADWTELIARQFREILKRHQK